METKECSTGWKRWDRTTGLPPYPMRLRMSSAVAWLFSSGLLEGCDWTLYLVVDDAMMKSLLWQGSRMEARICTALRLGIWIRPECHWVCSSAEDPSFALQVQEAMDCALRWNATGLCSLPCAWLDSPVGQAKTCIQQWVGLWVLFPVLVQGEKQPYSQSTSLLS